VIIISWFERFDVENELHGREKSPLEATFFSGVERTIVQLVKRYSSSDKVIGECPQCQKIRSPSIVWSHNLNGVENLISSVLRRVECVNQIHKI
jgi:hypothetical protein